MFLMKRELEIRFSLLSIALSLMILASCTPQKRANRHINKALRLYPEIANTTVSVLHDTIVTESVNIDTVFSHHYSKDTLIMKDKNLTLKYYYNIRDSTIYLSGKCDTITVYRDVPISVTNINSRQSFFNRIGSWIKWIMIVFVILLTLYLLTKFRR